MSDLTPKLPRAITKGTLGDGCECYVLGPRPEDAIMSQRGFVRLLTGSPRGNLYRYLAGLPETYWPELVALGLDAERLKRTSQKGGAELDENDPENLLSTASEADMKGGAELRFLTPEGNLAYGTRGLAAARVMNIYVRAQLAGELRKSQLPIAVRCQKALEGFGAIGVVTFIRQVSGYEVPVTPSLDPDIRNALVSVPLLAASVTNLSTTMTVMQQNLATLVGRIEAVERRPAGLDEASLKTFAREIKDSNDDLKAHLSKELERGAKQTVWVRPTKKGANDPMTIGLHILDTNKRFEHPFSGADFARACGNRMHADTVHMVLTNLASHEHRRVDILDHGVKVGSRWVRTPSYQRVSKSEAERRKLPGQYSFDEQVERVRQAKADERKKTEPN